MYAVYWRALYNFFSRKNGAQHARCYVGQTWSTERLTQNISCGLTPQAGNMWGFLELGSETAPPQFGRCVDK